MGCHTWFSRPITDKEFEKMKENAPKEIYYLTGDSKKNIEIGLYDKNLYDLLMKSYNENIPIKQSKETKAIMVKSVFETVNILPNKKELTVVLDLPLLTNINANPKLKVSIIDIDNSAYFL